MKHFLMVIIFIWFVFFFCALFFCLNHSVLEDEINSAISYYHLMKLLKKSRSSEITLLVVGDIMLNRGVEYVIEEKGNGDFRFPFLKIANNLNKADILFGNLEGPISHRGTKSGSIYSFRMDPRAVEGLKYAGFDILSLANNHMFDYGSVALIDTMNILKKNNIEYVGAGMNKKEAYSLKIIKIKNTKVGFLAYTNLGPNNWSAKENMPGIAWIDEDYFPQIVQQIRDAKKQTDILIVSLHSGVEYVSFPDDFQRKFAKLCIENGADIVIGHHPHVIQPVIKYKNGWIAYSLGNFVFDQSFLQDTMRGLVLEIKIRNGKIKEIKKREVKISKYFQPYF